MGYVIRAIISGTRPRVAGRFKLVWRPEIPQLQRGSAHLSGRYSLSMRRKRRESTRITVLAKLGVSVAVATATAYGRVRRLGEKDQPPDKLLKPLSANGIRPRPKGRLSTQWR